MPCGLGHAPCQLLARLPLPRVRRGLHPLELGEDVVGQVEAAVVEDVALGAAQDPERRELLVRARNLLGLAAQVVGVKARHDTHGAGVVADRDVGVAKKGLCAVGAGLFLLVRRIRPRRRAQSVARRGT